MADELDLDVAAALLRRRADMPKLVGVLADAVERVLPGEVESDVLVCCIMERFAT